MDDYDIDDRDCPKCGSGVTHFCVCDELYCVDGFYDEYEIDPINLVPGEELTECSECSGSGFQWWCPSCGTDLSWFTRQSTQK